MSGQATPCTLKIALLDDHDVVRHGSFVHLSSDPRFDVVGSHAHSDELITTLQRTPVDVAVVDYTLGSDDLTGSDLLALLRDRFPAVRVLLFTAHASRVLLSSVLRVGAAGMVTKTERLDALSDAVVEVANGHCRVPAEFGDVRPDAPLSRSERDVLRLCLSGLTVSEIALHRHRSIKTISTQKHAAFRKLGLRSDRDLFTLRPQLAPL
ncbi:response regulator transcription factor [Stenotrophomonas rhizophila]|uniref:response regulator transcription factor n=1 Tax=Stenotrophomonas rhizophila TaxID=216778 RepID=UPI002A6A3B6A|nr:response regulator transcription factor [Stenotrophomonas rhizophila]MDY0955587.1 response regulator transcription factor [Stenotrophomonas rhizophila]